MRFGPSYWGLNYERVLVNKPNWFVTGKLGLELAGISNSFTYNVGKKRHYAELGIGGHIGWTPFFGFQEKLGPGMPYTYDNRYFLYPILGYRFNPLNKRVILGIYLRPTRITQSERGGTPMTGQTYIYSKIIHSWIALKIGYSF